MRTRIPTKPLRTWGSIENKFKNQKKKAMANKQKNEFYINGKVIHIGMPIYFSEKMSKRVLIMEVYVDKYRQEVQFDFVNENMELLNTNIRNGDWVGIDFVLRGRKHIQGDGKARWFTNLEAVSVTKEE